MRTLSAQQRRRQQRADARRAILDATESLLVEEGYESFSIRRLVERCGYTAPTIYHHFGDKPGLLDALLEEVFQKLVRSIRRVPESDDPIEYLRALARSFVRFGLKNPTHYRLLTQPRDPAPPRRRGNSSRSPCSTSGRWEDCAAATPGAPVSRSGRWPMV